MESLCNALSNHLCFPCICTHYSVSPFPPTPAVPYHLLYPFPTYTIDARKELSFPLPMLPFAEGNERPWLCYKQKQFHVPLQEYTYVSAYMHAQPSLQSLSLNLCNFVWTGKTTGFTVTLMFTKTFSEIKCWSHKSSTVDVFFCSYMQYEVAREQINYLWLMPVQ